MRVPFDRNRGNSRRTPSFRRAPRVRPTVAPPPPTGLADQDSGSSPADPSQGPRNNSEHDAYVCHFCDARLTSISGFADHVNRHKGQYKYYCPYCQRGFMKKTHYEGHINKHENKRPYPCPYCDKSFSMKHNAIQHVRYVHERSQDRAAAQRDGGHHSLTHPATPTGLDGTSGLGGGGGGGGGGGSGGGDGGGGDGGGGNAHASPDTPGREIGRELFDLHRDYYENEPTTERSGSRPWTAADSAEKAKPSPEQPGVNADCDIMD